MKIVATTGQKGGTGKTLNTHAMAHGFSMLGTPAAYALTDNRRLLSDENRVYSIIDARSVDRLQQAVEVAHQKEGNGVLFIDGGGNRLAVDELLAAVADVVILPFGASDEDVYPVAEDMAKYPQAMAMPSNWPTNNKAADLARGYIEKLEELFPGRILPAVPATNAVRDLLLTDFSGQLLPPAQKFCRVLAKQVMELLPE